MSKPRISLHCFPPYWNLTPMPALAYLKGFIKKRSPELIIDAVYWNQLLEKLRLFYDVDLFVGAEGLEKIPFYQAVFTYLLLSFEERKDQIDEKLRYVEKYGALFLASHSIDEFKEFTQIVDEYINSEIAKKEFDKDHIIGCSILFYQELSSLYFLKKIKNLNPHIMTVLGGMTVKDAELLMSMFPFLDICVVGEGEQPFLELIRQFPSYDSLDTIKGIVFRKNSQHQVNEAIVPQREIDPVWADYSGFDWRYLVGRKLGIRLPIWDSRGCVWKRCVFCDLNRISPCFLERSPKSIIEEIKHHLGRHQELSENEIQIEFLGNDFRGSSNKRFIKLLQSLVGLKKDFPDIMVMGELSPSYINDEIMQHLNELEAFIQWGFEQWSPVVKKMRKRHRVEQGILTLKLVEKYPLIKLSGFNILVGFIGETIEDVFLTMRVLRKIRFLLSAILRENRLLLDQFAANEIWVSPSSPLGSTWDFHNPFVQEYLKKYPLTKFFVFLSGDEAAAQEFVQNTGRLHLFDVTATKNLEKNLIQHHKNQLEKLTIKLYTGPDNLLNLVIFEGDGREITVELAELDLQILKLTKEIIQEEELFTALVDYPKSKIIEFLQNLEEADLLFVDEQRYINTLPAHIQQQIELIAYK